MDTEDEYDDDPCLNTASELPPELDEEAEGVRRWLRWRRWPFDVLVGGTAGGGDGAAVEMGGGLRAPL